ncbi:CoB--CoM heterodisulfide reductase iron-sulfur subunit B family protein [Dehalobacterium formicoaceticum]|uniref:CoB--CoM heterodisulfide reductase iron-sulfur subunit B family protein n=1 Tax=Dehalobacterium formicoaceticum TaxID=51515 RepID=A0ABT1Y0U7_9FIRM|nr:CoB--CoM heterodisulfide reductase iron-sulfur subunit B family protein [Dehalobacterium formicoaceticum]MCR6544455.1 CoB--CoM heterodisulfide reductase iron-sulfur subunit B family protein [Dehalobacterium formicoaceticum]
MKYAYYPGCSLDATGIEYNLSTKLVAKNLEMELWEIPDWNCCGASSAHLTDHLFSLALPARNLAIAEKEGLDTVAIPCAACFLRSKAASEAVKSSPEMQQKISDVIEMDFQGKSEVLSMLDIMGKKIGLEKIKNQVTKPLTDMKVACYYGCLLVRPPKIAQSDDTEMPMVMDNIMEAIGAEPVPWSFKTECCGASHVVTKPEIGKEMIYEIIKNAQNSGAEAIATACPLCMLNLDMRQKQINARKGTNFNIPIYYFTELMAMSFGYQPKDVGMEKHFVPAEGLIQEVFGRSRREEA